MVVDRRSGGRVDGRGRCLLKIVAVFFFTGEPCSFVLFTSLFQKSSYMLEYEVPLGLGGEPPPLP